MRRGAEAAPSLRRGSSQRQLSARLWVFCEGKNTEPEWLDGLNQRLRGVLLEIIAEPACGVPKTLVEKASAKAREIRKRGRRDMAARDEVWVVFDRDEHPHVPEALCQARDNGLGVVFSNACFELWPLLHLVDQSAPQGRAALQSRLRQLHPAYDHGRGARVAWEQLCPAYPDALHRALVNHSRALERGDRLDNPTTTAWLLTERALRSADEQGAWFVELCRQRPALADLAELLPAPVRARAQAALSSPQPPATQVPTRRPAPR